LAIRVECKARRAIVWKVSGTIEDITPQDELRLTFRKYLVILSIVIFGSLGDAFLAHGIKQTNPIDIHHITQVVVALKNPFIVLGIISLIVFMWSYMTALSFADLTYVLPATAISYVLMVLLSIFWLHEHVSPQRWSGVVLIVIGVGIVAGGPSRTEHTDLSDGSGEALGKSV
jgi:drug/metabolite transporter (DMT)-like permease